MRAALLSRYLALVEGNWVTGHAGCKDLTLVISHISGNLQHGFDVKFPSCS